MADIVCVTAETNGNDEPQRVMIPDHIIRIFGDPVLMSYEYEDDYYDLWEFVAGDIQPSGMIEWTLSRRLADLAWMMRYYQRFMHQTLARKAVPFRNEDLESASRVRKSKKIDSEAKQRILEQAEEGYVAEGFMSNIELFERAERLLASAERRYNALLREIELRRAIVATRVRNTVDRFRAQVENVPLAPSTAEDQREGDAAVLEGTA